VTTRIGRTTSVLVLPQRHTALVAKQATEVDGLSRGRLRLGVGVGWIPDEFVALNNVTVPGIRRYRTHTPTAPVATILRTPATRKSRAVPPPLIKKPAIRALMGLVSAKT
jgi:alkanesulfonate monooxygenase SsuD/methylene tetrahydromethanopterin reductase-like flavin-dependent oxidoreductase (luciferase family)